MKEETKQPSNSKDRAVAIRRLKAEQFSRYFLLLVLVAIAIVFFNMVKAFLVPVMLAAAFTSLFYPLYDKLLVLLRNNRGASAFACCCVLLLGLLIPAYFVADLVAKEAIDFYVTAEQGIREIIAKGDQGLLGEVKNNYIVRRLDLDKIDWQASLQDAAKTAGTILASVINKTSQGTFQFISNLFITLFTMYYFFKDGERLTQRLKFLSPLDDKYEDVIMHRFVSVSRATMKGTLLIGIVQGTMGALTLWTFGIGSPILWGVIMSILSLIPMVGAWLVMYPAAGIQLISGNLWQGLAIFLISAIVIGNIDNVLRPRLVGRDAGMHDLMIFFSTIGGIGLFGVMGFLVGPVIAVLFLTILDIYSIEFKSHLELTRGGIVEGTGPVIIPASAEPAETIAERL